MAINTGMGFKVGNAEPIDARLVLSKAQMLAVNPIAQPEKYFCVCSDDSLMYVYDVNNEDDPETGKFRPIGASNEPIDLAEYQKISDDTLTTDDKTIPGAINELDSNKVNIPEIDGLENDVLTRDVDGNIVWKAVPETDITGKLDKPVVDGTTGQILVLQDDGTLAYQDNVTEYDDTAIQDALALKIDKPVMDGTAGQILVLQDDGTLAYQDNVTETPIATVDAVGTVKPDGTTITIDEDGVITAVGGEGGGVANWTTNISVGSLSKDTDLSDMSPLDILKAMTVAYINPTSTVSWSQTNTVIKMGQLFNLTVTVTSINKGTSDVEKLELYQGNTLLQTIPYEEGTASYTFDLIEDIGDTVTFKVNVVDVKGKSTSYTKSYSFVYPYYWGSSDDIPTADTILLGTEMIESKGNKTLTHNAANQYVFIAYPASYGNLTSILDSNNFENIEGFTKIELTMDSMNGTNYYCYYMGKLTVTGFKFNYKH